MVKEKITLITTFCNRYIYVPKVVESIINQDFPDLDIVFIDNGSTDDTKSYLNIISNEYSNIKLVRYDTNIGKPLALDREINSSDTEFILSLDGDVLLQKDTISSLLDAFLIFQDTYPDIALLSPRYKRVDYDTDPPDAHLYNTTISVYIGKYTFHLAKTVNIAGGCQLIKREIYNKVGGYLLDGQFYGMDDVSLFERLRANKFESVYVDGIRVKHLGDYDCIHFPEWQKVKTNAHSGPNRGKIYNDYSNLLTKK